MSIIRDPLFYAALSSAGMFLCAWLFDRAHKRYMLGTNKPEPATPSFTRILPNLAGTICGAILLWFALYRTNMVVVDLLLLAVLASFAIGSYRLRLRPLLARGLTNQHLAVLICAIGLCVLPMLWFVHLHLAGSYGAA